MVNRTSIVALCIASLLPFCASAQNLTTRWAASVTPENVHREYPRPQMVRPNWVNLNGLWDLKIIPTSGAEVRTKILVPFPVESQLSRVHRSVSPTDVLQYDRDFVAPEGERVLLHFGASDWHTIVNVNGRPIGEHKGGYDSFTFDITDALHRKGREHVTVLVQDPTDLSTHPRGKQVRAPGGIFYTSTSGIWQTVWLESVPRRSIERLIVKTDNNGGIRIGVELSKGSSVGSPPFTVELKDGNRTRRGRAPVYGSAVLHVANPKLWSPEHPNLYTFKVRWGRDEVTSYLAFREMSLVKDAAGQPRIALNGKPYFLVGPLDQGFWPDGIYTAPSEAAMKYDLEVTKKLGFNMIRKHVKVEPDTWYYWCDRMGIAVLQDMPSGDRSIGPDDPDIIRTPESKAIFSTELKAMVDALRNHPSIVSWVLFNEGWGQFDTAKEAAWLKKYDPTRLLDAVTGWSDRGVGDMHDVHVYPGPGAPPSSRNRALLLGEFGGLGLPMPGHMWKETGWGYQSYKTSKELTDRFVEIFDAMRFLVGKPGISGAVYTQTTDVETELNGLMTYDRAIIKMDEARVRQAVRNLFLPPPTLETVLPTSEDAGQTWSYTFDSPAAGWQSSNFAASDWRQGPGGFGTRETPGSVVRTLWNTKDIYLRRTFDLPRSYASGELKLRLHHDDDVEVFIDGTSVYKSGGWTTSYVLLPLPMALSPGRHTIAIHCHQNAGGQYIDAGIVRVNEERDPRREAPVAADFRQP